MASLAKFGKLRFGKLALLLAAAMLLSAFAVAQSPPANPSESQVSAAAPAASAETKSGESKESSGEDETTPFKHSPVVQWLGKKIGLSVDHAYWLAVVLNFIIVIALLPPLLKLILGSSLPAVFRSRTAAIQKSLAEARAASEDANRRLAEIESRLKHLGEEIGQMQATAEKSAAAEEERIRAAAEDDGRRI